MRSDNPISGGEIGNESFIATKSVDQISAGLFIVLNAYYVGVILYSFMCATITVLFAKLMQILKVATMWHQILHLGIAYAFWAATFVKTRSMEPILKDVTSVHLHSIGYSG